MIEFILVPSHDGTWKEKSFKNSLSLMDADPLHDNTFGIPAKLKRSDHRIYISKDLYTV
jgi:hypothetical protein